ncbi:futalosine hydrolase [Sphingobacterium sp. MYb382]|uniref:futalosine hydrolase n=1 Tax=Sphingobacterium sp. MYb382 TaxID=2745278 RepID=UPI0030A1B233
MMKVLFVAATQPEIAALLPLFESKNIDFICTGVGMLATSHALTKQLTTNTYDLIVNIGIAGILDPKTTLGHVYQITDDCIYELGAEDHQQFITIEDLGFGTSRFAQKLPEIRINYPSVPTIHGITVNKVHGAKQSISRLKSQYPSLNLLESMEGAAVFMVAQQEGIPVLQFRSSSNYIEPRNREAWQIGTALKNLHLFIEKFVASLG